MSFLFGFVLFEGESMLKKCRNFDGLSRQETIGQHFPMKCSKIGHSYESFTYLFAGDNFIRHLSADKNSPVDLWKLAVTGKFGLIRDSGTQSIHFFRDL